jgi:phospholipase/carboxylesterase
MRAWYDILSFQGINRQVDEAGIDASCASVRQLISEQNARGIATSKIFLAGFSQGGAMTYSAGLTHPQALAGLIVLSGYVPSQAYIESHASEANRHTPVFAAHGTQDDVLPVSLGETARDYVRARGSDIQWHAYPMPHSVSAEEIAALRAWLIARMG